MIAILQVFYAFFSSLLQTTAIPNEIFLKGFPALGIFCLAPLYVSANKSTTYRQSFFCFAIQTGFVHIFSSFWLGFYRDFAIFTLGASAAGTAVIGGFFGLFFHGVSSFSKRKTDGSAFFRIIWFASIWTAWEWLKSNFGFLAYPWGTLSMTAFSWTALIQIADITGAYGVSFLFALSSALTGEAIFQCKISSFSVRRSALAVASLYAIAIFYGATKLAEPRQAKKSLSALVVQQNIDPWIARDDRIGIRRSQELTDSIILKGGEKPDLVVWSEGVLNHAFPAAQIFYEQSPEENPLLPYIRRTSVPFIIGGAYTVTPTKVRPRRHSNVAFLFSKDGEIVDLHAKIHLVPFGEYIPGSENPKIAKALKSVLHISAGWIPGKKPSIFSVQTKKGEIKFAVPICFEDAFPDLHRKMFFLGSELFINITNDSWSMTRSAEWQHLAVAAYRSVEFRQTMVRATNSGCSAVILPTGKISALLPLFTEYADILSVPIFPRKTTVYARFGDVFAFSALFFCALAIIFSVLTFNKQKYIFVNQ